jgi:hypothetical protein
MLWFVQRLGWKPDEFYRQDVRDVLIVYEAVCNREED